MKAFKSPQRVIIIFLTFFIMLCGFFIVKLEIKAASLQSLWDEHQKSLKNNEDVLSSLNRFGREIKNNGPEIQLTKNNISLRNESSWFSMDFDKIKAVCDGNISFGNPSENYFGYDINKNETFLKGAGNGTIHIESSNGKCEINMKEKGIEIICTPLKGPIFGISIDPQLQAIDIDAGDASVILAKDEIHFIAEGDINITSKNGNVNIKGKQVLVNE